MIYAMSDIHGRDDMLSQMLELIHFDEKKDFLYVLGDVVDRGGDLTALYHVMDMVNKSCCELITGNREMLLMDTLNNFVSAKEVSDAIDRMTNLPPAGESITGVGSFTRLMLTASRLISRVSTQNEAQNAIKRNVQWRNYICTYGQGRCLQQLNQMTAEERKGLSAFFASRPVYKTLELNGKTFVLVHGGYSPERKDDYTYMWTAREEFYLNPTNDKDTIVIFGHTPTGMIRAIKYGKLEIPYTIWHDETGDKICVDCGAPYPHGQLGCLRLDDMAEFYIKNERNMITPLDYRNQQMEILQEFEREMHKRFYNQGGDTDLFANT